MYILLIVALVALAALAGAVMWLWFSPYPMDMPLSLLTLLKFLIALKATTRKVRFASVAMDGARFLESLAQMGGRVQAVSPQKVRPSLHAFLL